MKTAQASVALFAFWLVLTGSIEPVTLGLGVLFSVALGAWSARYLWDDEAPTLSFRQSARFFIYIFELLHAVVIATVQVAETVLSPRMPISPVVIGHRTSFTRDVSRVAYANSITLTPGTLTLDVEGDTFRIHCLAERFADDIASGKLERRIVQVFEEE